MPEAIKAMVDGLVVVDKPAGFTSHDIVARLRKAFGQRRIGHAGTLDPDATGVLLVGLGRATRLLRFLQVERKEYRATVCFGIATSTLDAAGDELRRCSMTPTRDEVAAAAQRFVGDIEQIPPMVSAVKVGGRRLHELARAGEEVDRAPRHVHVERFEVEAFEPGEYPVATVFVECGSGTYVRSLAADLGEALGGCAHVGTLRRLRVGSFGLDEAHSLEEIETNPLDALLPAATAMRDLERVDLDENHARAVRYGNTFPLSEFGKLGDGPFAFVSPQGDLLAVYEHHDAGVKPAVVVASPVGE